MDNEVPEYKHLFEIAEFKQNDIFNKHGSLFSLFYLYLQNYNQSEYLSESGNIYNDTDPFEKNESDISNFIKYISNVESFENPTKLINNAVPFCAIKSTDSRISLMSAFLGIISKILNFHDKEGNKVDYSYFSLKNINNWKIHHKNQPPITELIVQLMRSCNANCDFCYIKGDPSNISIPSTDIPLGKSEFKQLLKAFDPIKQESLYSPNYAPREIFSNENSIHFLNEIRKKDSRSLFFVTNGIGLDEKKIQSLKKLEPIVLIISVNTFSKEKYEKHMDVSDYNKSKVLKTLKSLELNELHFGASIVANAEHPNNFNDILKTLKILDQFSPAFTRINIAGYTKNYGEILQPANERTGKILKFYHERIIGKFNHPVFLIPIYEYLNFLSDDLYTVTLRDQ